MNRELAVFMGDVRAGTLSCEDRASSFEYDAQYLSRADATPLSLSMPLHQGVFAPEIVDPFLWGLLPDNAETLQRWAILARPPADEHNPFTLLQHYGRDCAGAIRFVNQENSEHTPAHQLPQWLTDEQIGAQLRSMRADPNAWTFDDTEGRFSLAGAQAKIALVREGTRWGRPFGSAPTTHIIKPGIPEYRANALNEHVCLEIASRLDLPAARSTITTFAGEQAIVVERYDRQRRGEDISRIHQEDFCQALHVMPSQKYQDDGGPSLARMAALIRRVQSRDSADDSIGRLLLAVAYNWLIAAPDAHAKNYSLLLRGNKVSLAPLYDIASIAPYPQYNPSTAKIAQSVGGEYRIARIGHEQWAEEAAALGLDGAQFLERVRALAAAAPGTIDIACREPSVLAIDAEFVAQLRKALLGRVGEAAKSLV